MPLFYFLVRKRDFGWIVQIEINIYKTCEELVAIIAGGIEF